MVKDGPIMVRFNIRGHLGGQMSEIKQMGNFWDKLVCYSPPFQGWARASGVFLVKN